VCLAVRRSRLFPIVPGLCSGVARRQRRGLSRGISRCFDVLHQLDTCAPDSLMLFGGGFTVSAHGGLSVMAPL
jgi:hypothetical protein